MGGREGWMVQPIFRSYGIFKYGGQPTTPQDCLNSETCLGVRFIVFSNPASSIQFERKYYFFSLKVWWSKNVLSLYGRWSWTSDEQRGQFLHLDRAFFLKSECLGLAPQMSTPMPSRVF